MAYLLLMCRILLLLVFLVAAVGKARPASLDRFARSLGEYEWIPPGLRRSVAYGVVLSETAIVLLLVLPRWLWLGFALALLVTAVFTAVTVASLARGRRTTCQCFGTSGTMPQGAPHLVRNVFLIGAAGVGIAGWMNAAPSGVSPTGVVVATATAAIGAVAVVRMEDLVFLAARAPRAHQQIGGRS